VVYLLIKIALEIISYSTGVVTIIFLLLGITKASVFLSTFSHELGHALFAKLAGIPVDYVNIGICCDDVFTLKILGIPFRFGKIPLFEKNYPSGFTQHQDKRASIWSYLIYALGGVIFNVIFSVLGFISAYYLWKNPSDLSDLLLWLIYIIPFFISAVSIINLLPVWKTDGRHILLLLGLKKKGVKKIVYHTAPPPMWYDDGENVVYFKELQKRKILIILLAFVVILCLEPVLVIITHGTFKP
jgi:membrane-associated protease RseP (regulator of RpoE activity)